MEKHEIEDRLPLVYEEATGVAYPGGSFDNQLVMGAEEMELLRDLCGSDSLHFQLIRELLSIEKQHKSMLRRTGLFKALEKSFLRNFYSDESDAISRARKHRDALKAARDRLFEKNVSTEQNCDDPGQNHA